MSNKCRVVEYTTTEARYARRGTVALPIGSKLYLVQHLASGKYFARAYTDKTMAELIAQKIPAMWRDTDLYFNFTSNPEMAVYTDRKVGEA